MNLTLVVKAIIAALQFPGEISAILRFLESAPEEQRLSLRKRMEEEADQINKTGRPKW